MLNPIEEKKFQELKDRCRELRVPPPPDLMIGLQVHDENGILVFDDVQRGHSWTRNFWNWAAWYMGANSYTAVTFGAGYITSKTTAGNVVNTAQCGWNAGPVGTLGNGFGIIVGTGDAAFSVENYGLGAVIAQGTGAGQFSHAAQNAWTGAYTAGTKTWKATSSRIFNNNSGGSITVKETGITNTGSGVYVLFERSVLDPTVTVATGGQLTVTYEISMDFSAID